MSYDTILNDVMTPPRGAPRRADTPGPGPRFRLKSVWPPGGRAAVVILLTLSVAWLAGNTFAPPKQPPGHTRRGQWHDSFSQPSGATTVPLPHYVLLTVACGLVMLALRRHAAQVQDEFYERGDLEPQPANRADPAVHASDTHSNTDLQG